MGKLATKVNPQPAEGMCACGAPLHYPNAEREAAMERMVKLLGPTVRVTSVATGKRYAVPRHYISLHGVRGEELDSLGFAEINGDT